MSACGHIEKISASLDRYFERQVVDGGELLRCEPAGYRTDYDREAESVVVRHEASGLRAFGIAVDLVERVDKKKLPEPARVVYVYLPVKAFRRVGELAQRQPRLAWAALLEEGALRRVVGAGDDGRQQGNAWYGLATALEPAAVAQHRQQDRTQKQDCPWHASDRCVALFVKQSACRQAGRGGREEALEILGMGPPDLEVDPGKRLVAAAGQRDAAEVAALLEVRADPNSQDARGWTALHAASGIRPCWEVLDQLLPIVDPTIRSLCGELAVDIAEACNHDDTVAALQVKLQQHKKGRFLPQAAVSTEMSKNKAAGATQSALKGKRRGEEESLDILRDFAIVVMKRYSNSDKAFRAFDINKNGSLSGSEFVTYANLMGFPGDVTAVFKALDGDRQGDLSIHEFKILQELYDDFGKD